MSRSRRGKARPEPPSSATTSCPRFDELSTNDEGIHCLCCSWRLHPRLADASVLPPGVGGYLEERLARLGLRYARSGARLLVHWPPRRRRDRLRCQRQEGRSHYREN